MHPELACNGDPPAHDGQVVLMLQVLLQQTTSREHAHCFEERSDEGLKQGRPAQVLADSLVLELRESLGQPEQPQQHTTAFVCRRRAILSLRQDLEDALAQADHTTELSQLHLAVTHLTEAWPLLPDLGQPLGFCRCEAPSAAIGGDRYGLVFQRSQETS
jgi:hypothetical protein